MNNKTEIDVNSIPEDFGFGNDNNMQINDDIEMPKDQRFEKLYDLVIILLDKLSENPEKETIFWPKRIESVKLFKDKIENIKNGE